MTLARSGTGGCCPQVDHFVATVLADGGAHRRRRRTSPDWTCSIRAPIPSARFRRTAGKLGPGPGRSRVDWLWARPRLRPSNGSVASASMDWLGEVGTRLPDGRMLFTDHVGSDPLVLHPEFDPAESLPWSAMLRFNDVLWDRYGVGTNVQTITPLPDGRSLVFASRPDETNHPLRLGFASVFDPNLVTFTEVASPAGATRTRDNAAGRPDPVRGESRFGLPTGRIRSRPAPSCSTSGFRADAPLLQRLRDANRGVLAERRRCRSGRRAARSGHRRPSADPGGYFRRWATCRVDVRIAGDPVPGPSRIRTGSTMVPELMILPIGSGDTDPWNR